MHRTLQASMIAEELLKQSPEAIRVIFNKFRSAISYKPTVATVLLGEVRPADGPWLGRRHACFRGRSLIPPCHLLHDSCRHWISR